MSAKSPQTTRLDGFRQSPERARACEERRRSTAGRVAIDLKTAGKVDWRVNFDPGTAHLTAETLATHRDERHLMRAIELASEARGHTSPNPLVGAVVVKNGRTIGEGFHQ